MNELRRPIVTGAGGFIGSHLARKLAELPEVEFVYIVDLPSSQRLKKFADSDKFRVIECNLSETSTKHLLPNDATIVFALAALNGTSRFYSKPYTVLINSTLPTLNIIDFYAGKAPIVYSSSSEVYASSTELFGWGVPTSEVVPLSISDIHNPRWSYATAKLFGEVALVNSVFENGGSGSIIRYHNVYGPDMGFDHFVPDFINRVENGIFKIYGSEQTRAFMYIDDAVDGTILAGINSSNQVPLFHLGSTNELTILEASRIILNEMKLGEVELELLDAPKGSVSRRCADVTKAKVELGWEAKTDFSTGIRSILNKRTRDENSHT